MRSSLLHPLDSDTRRRVAVDPFAGPGLRFLVVYVQALSFSMHREQIGFWRLPERSAGHSENSRVIHWTDIWSFYCIMHAVSQVASLSGSAMAYRGE